MPNCGHLLAPMCGCASSPGTTAPSPPPPVPPTSTGTLFANMLRDAGLASEPQAVELDELDASPELLDDVPSDEPELAPGPKIDQYELRRRNAAEDSVEAARRAAIGAYASGDLAATRTELMRRSFARFFREAWKEIEPSTELVWNWHLQLICNVLQAVFLDWKKAKLDRRYRNLIRNIIYNVPPGSSKSRIISVCFHVWMWLHAPGAKLIAMSVNDDAAMRDARDARKLIDSTWFKETFGITWSLKQDQGAVSNYGNTIGGERLSMPSKSVVVGVRADCLIVDDPNDPSENETERNEVNHIWDSTQSNRVNDLARSIRIGVQQRTNSGDWTAHVIERQGLWSLENTSGWLHVVLPAEFEAARKFVMPPYLVELLREQLPDSEIITEDPRTEEGESIDKLRMPPEVLAAERKRWAGTLGFATQMQQRPADLEGARVKRDYWGWFRLEGGVRDAFDEIDNGRPRPDGCHTREKMAATLVKAQIYSPGYWEFDKVAISIDCAAKKTERGSNWGILVCAVHEGHRYVLDDRTRRGDILEIIEVLRDLVKLWRPDAVLIEDKAAGPDLKIRLLGEMNRGAMAMIELVDVKVGGDGKEARLDACVSVLANGFVSLLEGAPWLEEFVDELALFPNGRQSDRVDALTQFLNHFAATEDAGDSWPTW